MSSIRGGVTEFGDCSRDLLGDPELLGLLSRPVWRDADELDIRLTGATGKGCSADSVGCCTRLERDAILGWLDPSARAVRVPGRILGLSDAVAERLIDGERKFLRVKGNRCLAVLVAHHHGRLQRCG